MLWEEDHLTVSGIAERLFLDSGTLTPAGEKLRRKAEGIAKGVACALGVELRKILLRFHSSEKSPRPRKR